MKELANSAESYLVAVYSFATVLLVFVTIWYAISTQRLVNENKKLRESYRLPNIYLNIGVAYKKDGNPYFYYLAIENSGGGSAKEIKYSIIPDIYISGSQKLSELLKSIGCLQPQEKHNLFLKYAESLNNGMGILETELHFEITFKDEFDQEQLEKFSINPATLLLEVPELNTKQGKME